MSKFHKLKIVDIVRETADSVSLAFHIPENLKNDFKYIQGQYISLKLNVNNEEIRRAYSICSTPLTDENLRVAVKKVNGGKGSVYLNEKIKVGDELEVMTPMGNFYSELNPTKKNNFVLFAGGSGITPMLSIIKTSLIAEPQSSIILFYANRNEESIIFKNQLNKISEEYSARFKIYHILDQSSNTDELFVGIMTTEKAKILHEKFINSDSENEYFICGPSAMMSNVEKTLNDYKIEKSKIHIEYFTTSTTQNQPSTINRQPSLFVCCDATIICDGDEKIVHIEPDTTILQAALDANFDAPYACRGGSCCTCRAKLMEGKVSMDLNYALLDSEVAEGYILTCQSHPLTPTVVVDYDNGR